MTDTPNTVQPLRSDRGPGMTHTRRQATMTHELLVRRLASTTTALTRSSLQDRSGHAVATQPVTYTHRAHRNPRVSKCALSGWCGARSQPAWLTGTRHRLALPAFEARQACLIHPRVRLRGRRAGRRFPR